MKKIFHKIEHLVDILIPYVVLILLGVIIITFFFKEIGEKYHSYIQIADYIIISFFVVDLTFKYIRVRNMKKFFKRYWIDLVAIFPFYLFLRAIEEITILYRLSEVSKESQSVLHAGTELRALGQIEKDTALIVREAESLGRASRSRFAIRFLRPIARIPRLLKVLPYFERTTGSHHIHDPERKSRTR